MSQLIPSKEMLTMLLKYWLITYLKKVFMEKEKKNN